MKFALLIFTCIFSLSAFGEVIPEKPTAYFTDNLGIVSQEQARSLNEELAQYERDTSNQVLIVTYPMMQSEGDPALYATAIANAWQVGQADKRNGLVLFFWDKTMRGKGRLQMAVGYGLEGAIPDLTATRITNRMKTTIRTSPKESFSLAIDDIKRAIAKEHSGIGKTKHESKGVELSSCVIPFAILVIIIGVTWLVVWRRAVALRHRAEERMASLRRSIPPRSSWMPPPVYTYVPLSRSKPRTEPSSSYIPTYVPSYSRSDSSSDGSSSSSSFSSFESGGGSFGGGGGGSDV